MTDGYIQHRRAIEALRSGVPSRDAVRALGIAQPEIEEQFAERLEATKDGITAGTQAPGLLVDGDFGSGKSHLLEYLQHAALEQGFVCSKIVISKETPLYDPAKLYRAAIEAAVVPGRKGAALTEVASRLQSDSAGYAALDTWANRAESELNSRFAATLYLYRRVRVSDGEIADRIVRFWAGDPLNVSELRRWLRAYGETASYRLEKVTARELTLQRFRYAPRLMSAAGYAGWVLLVDEVELIGRYSIKQRSRSYAELARWAGRLHDQRFPGLVTVFAITSDFGRAVLEDRGDEESVPARLRGSGLDADRMLASQAERGMRFISREAVPLRPADRGLIDQTREQVQDVYARAYDWQPPALTARDDLALRMRQHVRRWINEWDLLRLYPGEHVETVIGELHPNYAENLDLEVSSEGDSAEDGPAESV